MPKCYYILCNFLYKLNSNNLRLFLKSRYVDMEKYVIKDFLEFTGLSINKLY
jgi:hypothetical protein